VSEQEGKVRDWLKNTLRSAVTAGTVSTAARVLLVSPFIAPFVVFGGAEAAYIFIDKLLGEPVSEKLRKFLGIKKYSEKDAEEIFKIAKENEEVRKILEELMNKLIDEELLEKLEKETPGSLEAISQAVDELKKEIPDIKGRLARAP
jgi:ATP phosphoribosyltransferase regulatory subunit HisZ